LLYPISHSWLEFIWHCLFRLWLRFIIALFAIGFWWIRKLNLFLWILLGVHFLEALILIYFFRFYMKRLAVLIPYEYRFSSFVFLWLLQVLDRRIYFGILINLWVIEITRFSESRLRRQRIIVTSTAFTLRRVEQWRILIYLCLFNGLEYKLSLRFVRHFWLI